MVNRNKIKTSKDIFDNSRPNIEDLSSITDSYFTKSKSICLLYTSDAADD